MSILEHPNFLFISFEQAARGHRLARVLSAMPNVYWYSHPDNGKNSWNVIGETNIQQRWVSKFHYNRYVPKGQLPPPHDFVKPYLPDADVYYNGLFQEKFKENGGEELLDKYLLPYCTHSLPHNIFRYFPNAKIINIIHDVDACVERYKVVGLEFPGFVKHIGTVPEQNPYRDYLTRLNKLGNFDGYLKVKDIWADQKYGKPWNDDMHKSLILEKRFFFETQYHARVNVNHNNVFSTTNVKDYKKMKDFINNS